MSLKIGFGASPLLALATPYQAQHADTGKQEWQTGRNRDNSDNRRCDARRCSSRIEVTRQTDGGIAIRAVKEEEDTTLNPCVPARQDELCVFDVGEFIEVDADPLSFAEHQI